ncbi:MAG: XdhC/CoxI family protein [Candidatus Caldarchaeum sp.]
MKSKDLLAQALELHQKGESFCLAVIVGKSGSAPQVPGAKSLFLRDGRILGTIGGGCLEMESRRIALEALFSKRHYVREFRLDDDFGWDDGLICGGRVRVLFLPNPESYWEAFLSVREEGARGVLVYDGETGRVWWVADGAECALPVEHREGAERAKLARRCVLSGPFFFEPVVPPERVVIFGAGHIGRELCRLASYVGFEVVVVDDRETYLTIDRLPDAVLRVCAKPDEYAREMEMNEDTYICIVTRGHRNDARVLREVVKRPCAYIGMIGSRRKREIIRKMMVNSQHCTEEEFARVRSPMGLDIHSESVEEIALSIVAELVSVRGARRGAVFARCPAGSPRMSSKGREERSSVIE